MGYKIIADSVSDIPKDIREALDIEIVPLEVNFPGKSYKDSLELDSKAFFKMLKESEALPTTSQVNPGEFIEVFKKHLAEEDELILVTLSSKLSGTYSAAVTARSFLDANDKITIIDSESVSLGYGLMVVEAARMKSQGVSKEDVIEHIKSRIGKVENIFVFDTLTYLHKGGRLSAGEAMIGGLLNIKPIITVEEGELKPLDKVRGRKRTIDWVIERMKASETDFNNATVAIYHGDDCDYMEAFRSRIENELGVKNWIIGEVGAVVGTHSGPGCVAISYVSD
ncbi:DegV family protein [Fusibacter sp. JL216-2]|uniref:DegV family protein n=1 Tax=Fusibacter sp. JL216-2 TaxID=3071453 RepID=UPI003D3549A4